MSRQEPAPGDRSVAGGPADWQQRGGFSIFFDAAVDDAGDAASGETWRTRVYHEETGQEIVLAGLGETEWPGWILGRLGGPARPDRSGVVHQVTVEVVDVRLVHRTSSGDDTEVVRVEAGLLLRGTAALERGVGAAVLDRCIGRPPT